MFHLIKNDYFNGIKLFIVLGNHKDYNNRRHREASSPDESMIPPGSRVPLSRSISSPATANYGTFSTPHINQVFLNDVFIYSDTLF